jgi:GNAT superfamily N-acetyltransferase
VRRLVTVDHDLREAVVAEVGGEVVGVARYDRSPSSPGTAELAVLVEHDWQGVGIGRHLLTEVIELARRHGVTTLVATVQEDNDRMLWLLRQLLPAATLQPEHGVYELTAPLPAPFGAPSFELSA